jgi:hypothetical protein
LNLIFNYETKQLSLNIVKTCLKTPEAEQVPRVLLSGNFDCDFSAEFNNQRVVELEKILNNWQDDLVIYTDVVNKLIVDNSNVHHFSQSEEKVLAIT